MPSRGVADFIRQISEARALDGSRMQEVSGDLQARHADAKSLAKELVRRGWLTTFQANELLKGRGEELVIGPYVLLDKLGEGGSGAVYQARHQMMKRTVALKVLRPGRLSGAAIQRFQQEIEAAAALSHPHIVTAHDAGRAGDLFYFAMEHLEGATLEQAVRQRGPLPTGEACLYAVQAAQALQHACGKGLVHRDLKPGNLFLTGGGTVKLLDLGLARVQATSAEKGGRALTQLGAIMGTPDYMPPEQISDARGVDVRGDIYSLGCTLSFLLTGRPPCGGKTIMEKMDAHLKTAVPSVRALRPDVPEGLDAVVRKMMAKAPAERYQTPDEVAQALRPFCGAAPVAVPVHAPVATIVPGDTVAAGPANPHGTAVPPARRRRRALLAAALAALTVALGLGVWLWKGKEKTKEADADGRPNEGESLGLGEPVRVPFDSQWLDRLDAANIPPGERYDWQPKELCAVLGEHRLRGDMIAVSPDGRTLATVLTQASYAWPEFIRLGDVEDLHERRLWRAPVAVTALAFLPDGRTLAAAHADGAVRLWDVAKGSEQGRADGHDKRNDLSLAVSHDGKRLAVGSGTVLWVWDVSDVKAPKELHRIASHSSDIQAVSFAPSGYRLLSACGPRDAMLRLWGDEGKLLNTFGIPLRTNSTRAPPSTTWPSPRTASTPWPPTPIGSCACGTSRKARRSAASRGTRGSPAASPFRPRGTGC
jgi:hypothetical protein